MSNQPTDLSHAFSLHQSGRTEEARRAYERVLELGENAEALHWLGVLELQAGNAQRALVLLKEAATQDHTNPQVFANLGNAFLALSQFTDARAALESSLRLNPESPETLASLGNVCLSLQSYKEAVHFYQQALKFNSNLVEVWRCLATALSATGRNRSALDAIQSAERACVASGQSVPLPVVLTRGNVLVAMGHPDQALASFKQVVDAAPAFSFGHISLANAHRELGNFATAAEHYERAVQLEPDSAEPYFAWGVLRQDEGDLDEARRLFAKTLKRDSLHGKAHRLLASLTQFESGHPHIARMQEALIRSQTNEQRTHINFALGQAYEECAEYDRAFECIRAANTLHRSSIDYSIEQDVDEMSAIASAIDSHFMQKHKGSGNVDENPQIPVFIVGMPRSGTSLIEQILASHPEVHGAGELDWFERIVDQALTDGGSAATASARMSRLAQCSPEQVQEMGAAYRNRLTSLTPSRWVVDKMPANFRHVGLIRAALPEAVIVHAQRHPVATCWSIYKLFLGKSGHAYSFELGELGQYYRAYRKLMQHFQRTVGQSVIQTVHYENLVSDHETATRELVEACGLEWHKDCLNFHQTRRPVTTLSAAQVRRPIYRDALDQWQHYSGRLEPLLEALGEATDSD